MPDDLIRYPCPHCGKRIKSATGMVGKAARCPRCRKAITVPAAWAADLVAWVKGRFAVELAKATSDGGCFCCSSLGRVTIVLALGHFNFLAAQTFRMLTTCLVCGKKIG